MQVATQTTSTEDGITGSRLYFAVIPLLLAAGICSLDAGIANVALPSISATLHATPADCVWIVNAFQLPMAMAILPVTSLGDRIGFRRIYMSGLFVFTLASFFCAISHTLDQLIAARILQGIGAAGISGVNTALVKQIYPPRLLGRGVSINSCVVAFSAIAGPSVAGLILSFAQWPWLFMVNVPVGIAAFIASYLALPRETPAKAPYDFVSAILNAASVGLIMLAVERLGHGAGFSVLTVAQAGVAIICAVALVRREKERARPMLPVDLLRKPKFLLAVLTSMASFSAQGLALVSMPFMLHAMGYGAVSMGKAITPWPIAIICAAPVAGILTDRYKASVLSGIGLLILAAGLAALAAMPDHATLFSIGWRMAICGAGFAFFQAPNNKSILSQVPPGRTGNGSGMISMARISGQILGATLTALILMIAPNHVGSVALYVATAFALTAASVSFIRSL
jgi:DHA2 family multidrug resistance protein-like MFS transporter